MRQPARIFFLSALLVTSFAFASESGPGNGTDYVKVLFADAQYDLNRSLLTVGDKEVAGLDIAPEIKRWLLTRSQSVSRLEHMKIVLRKLDLRFQTEPCSDGSGKPASICFFKSSQGPYVLISLSQNRMTTKDQAIAMLVHEAGHFTGETNHLLLDKIGVQIAAAVRHPKILIADAQNTEIVPNIFQAKEECELGRSRQARILKQEVEADLQMQCSNRRIRCSGGKARFIYKGMTHFERGTGFDMKVTCAVKGILNLP